MPNSVFISYREFGIEILAGGAGNHAGMLDGIRGDILDIAARSRGWSAPDEIQKFTSAFKIEPLFRADALALVWHNQRIVGVMGTNLLPAPDAGIDLHMCTLGLLPEVQNRGLLPTIFAMLWEFVGKHPSMADRFQRNRVYLSAITQNPYIYSFLGRVSELSPSPDRPLPDRDVLAVASDVIARYEPEVDFDPRSFVLRHECEFGYRKFPYSQDRRLNSFCDTSLRYDEGDTFILVGRVQQRAIEYFIRASHRADPDLFECLRGGLVEAGIGSILEESGVLR